MPWRSIVRWAGLLAAVAAVVAVIIVLFGPVTDLIVRHDAGAVTGTKRAAALQSARDAARGRLLQLGAGLFAAAALIYTARNFTLSRQGQVTDRYAKAIEQIGSDKSLDMRIGGIYALERVARDSVRDHPTIMEVLAAFVREHSHEQWPPSVGKKPGAEPPEHKTRPDVQAAVTVLGRRNPRHDRQPINLATANLADADLGGADFTNAFLRGADLTRAYLVGTDLRGANLSGARWSIHFEVPEGWHLDYENQRLKRADSRPGWEQIGLYSGLSPVPP
jgi:Pentapeptide repeats (8 copies)